MAGDGSVYGLRSHLQVPERLVGDERGQLGEQLAEDVVGGLHVPQLGKAVGDDRMVDDEHGAARYRLEPQAVRRSSRW